MKQLMLFSVLAALLFGCIDNSDNHWEIPQLPPSEHRPLSEVLDVLSKDSLLILDIGNSYTDDATEMLADVAEASGVDVSKVGIYTAVRGYASFKSWLDCYYDRDSQTYFIKKACGGLGVNATLGTSAAGDGSAFRQLLQQNVWDIVVLHQVSAYAPYGSEWFGHGDGGYLGELLSVVKQWQPQALIGFYVVHSQSGTHAANREHSSLNRWPLTVNSLENLVDSGLCDLVVPYGTAVENLRASSINNEYDLTRDGAHLELSVARYAAACSYYETILAPRYGVSVLGQTFHWKGPKIESANPIVGLDDYNVTLAQRAAVMAVADWRHCHNPETESLPLRWWHGSKGRRLKGQ